MVRRGVAVACVIGCLLGLGSVSASAFDFAADMVGEGEEGAFQGKMYVTGGNVRMEMMQMVMITRPDLRVVWMIMPSEGMYMEQPLKPRDAITSGAADEIERKPLGPEAVNGKPANKFEVTYDYEGERSTVYEWVDSSLGMPVKTAAIDGSWSMEYRNIQTGPQEASLFEVPEDYQKFSMPSF